MTFSKFFEDECSYSVSSYFYRVEFQQRGAPHVHCLLWLEDIEGNPAPTFWSSNDDKTKEEDKIKLIENIAEMLISASTDSALCDNHHNELQNFKKRMFDKDGNICKICYSAKTNFVECQKHMIPNINTSECTGCNYLKEFAKKFQTHNHTFTCRKKKKTLIIKSTEGHGRNDGKIEANKISDYIECRFNFPQFPMNRTLFIRGMSKDLTEEEIKQRKTDLKKIKKYLIRQTYKENNEESEQTKSFNKFSFIKFLYEVGMFLREKQIEDYSESEKEAAYIRYIDALSASIRGTGAVFVKRATTDVFTNNFNRRVLGVHKANHDIQIVVDQVNKKFSFKTLQPFPVSVCLRPVCYWIFNKE